MDPRPHVPKSKVLAVSASPHAVHVLPAGRSRDMPDADLLSHLRLAPALPRPAAGIFDVGEGHVPYPDQMLGVRVLMPPVYTSVTPTPEQKKAFLGAITDLGFDSETTLLVVFVSDLTRQAFLKLFPGQHSPDLIDVARLVDFLGLPSNTDLVIAVPCTSRQPALKPGKTANGTDYVVAAHIGTEGAYGDVPAM